MKSRFFVVVLLILLGFNLSNAQVKTISGVVVDSVTKAKLPGVTVVALSKNDNKILNGAATNENGQFKIKGINAKDVVVKFTMVGYKPLQIDSLEVKANLDLGTIALSTSAVLLSEVEIRGQRPMVEYQVDKRIINMDKVPGNTGSVSDALKNTGIVDVDPSTKKISVRGNSSVNIMIDGRPLPGADMLLSQMPASYVEKVEISTNPSAKEDAEGEAGILNIVTKKNTSDNYNGSISLYGSTQRMSFGNVMLNYKKGSFNFYSSFMGYIGQMGNRSNTERKNYNSNSLYYLTSEGKSDMQGNMGGLRLGADYDPDPNNSFSLTGYYNRMNFDINSPNYFRNYNSTFIPVYNYQSTTSANTDNETFNYTAYYKRKFNDKGHEITADAYYLKQDNVNDVDLTNEYDYMPLFPGLQKTKMDVKNNTVIIKTDYVNPTADYGKFEAGYRYTFRDRENGYGNSNYSYKSNTWLDSMGLSNVFRYKENIHALYLTYSNKVSVFDIKAGIRLEQTYSNGNQKVTGDEFNSDYLSYFPSLALSYKATDMYQVLFNMARRINRPQMEYINPFTRVNGPNNIYRGNPRIDPTYVNLYELKFSPYVNLFHTNSKGRPTSFSTIENDSVYVTTMVNASSTKTYGVELTLPIINEPRFPIKLPDWFLMANFNFSYTKMIEEAGYQADNYSIQRNTIMLTGNMSFKLWYEVNASFYFNYQPERKDSRFIGHSIFYSGLQLSRSFLERKLQLSFGVFDLFNSMKYENETYTASYYAYSSFRQIYTPSVTLSITYNFNDFKRKAERSVDDGRDKTEGGMFNN